MQNDQFNEQKNQSLEKENRKLRNKVISLEMDKKSLQKEMAYIKNDRDKPISFEFTIPQIDQLRQSLIERKIKLIREKSDLMLDDEMPDETKDYYDNIIEILKQLEKKLFNFE